MEDGGLPMIASGWQLISYHSYAGSQHFLDGNMHSPLDDFSSRLHATPGNC